MAISASLLAAAASTTDATSYLTSSQTPTANALQLIGVHNSIGTGPALAPTSITGCGLTWVKVAETAAWGVDGIKMVSLWRALGASPTTGQLTIDFNGVTQTGCHYDWWQLTGIDTSGTNGSGAIVQSAPNHLAVIFCGHGKNEAKAQETGYTELGDVSASTPGDGFAAAYLLGQDTSPSYSWVTSTRAGAVAAEIRAAAGTTYTKAGAVVSAAATAGPDVLTASETGAVVSTTAAQGGE